MPRHHGRHGRGRYGGGRHGHRDRSNSGDRFGHRRGGARDVMASFRARFGRFTRPRCGTTVVYRAVSTSHNQGAGRSQEPKPPKDVLSVVNCDLKVKQNTRLHKTDQYEICQDDQPTPQLVVRRGQCFNMMLEFSKPYDAKNDDLRIVFEAGDNPSAAKGTEVEIILSDKDEPREWGAKILKQEGNSLTVTIFTPPTCYVGQWDLSIDIVKKDNNNACIYKYEHEEEIYIIFNPWCKDDAVFLDDEKLLEEYVLNESGCIFAGSKTNISSKPWNFGQFEGNVLDVALHLLELSGLNWSSRGNPVPVIRKLSAAVNSSDDEGVLTGNWSGDYSGGRSPLSWTGSVAILDKFWRTKRPVEFGQCWVFSGLCTSVARALGIPARSVTNFASAHDTDGSITIDVHYNAKGEPGDDNPDSIWNFHVWNEAWCARADLPAGFGGWQAFDATPQEASDGIMCCGPVSVAAVRKGEVNLPFDAPFVFAEVNADQVYWQPDHIGKMKNVFCESKKVGKKISTKLPGPSNTREDITLQYKPQEGSAEERACVLKANQLCSTRPDAYKKAKNDVMFEVVQDSENTWCGEDFNVTMKASNCGDGARLVSGTIVVKTMYYTGVACHKLLTRPFSVHLQKGKSEETHVSVKPADYIDKLADCCMFHVSVWATVKETNQCWVASEDFRLRKPHLSIKGPSEATKGQEFEVDVSFKNPFDTSLTGCTVTVDGLARELVFPQKNVAAHGTFMATIPITAYKVGQKELILLFSSKQLDDINVSKRVFVRLAAV